MEKIIKKILKDLKIELADSCIQFAKILKKKQITTNSSGVIFFYVFLCFYLFFLKNVYRTHYPNF